ncbi:MAG: aromatic ring-opening dioxygenase subunit LigA [Proteobacteria bacterium]|nr:aromatic ring-opening dioxygenase subunit LigA [Pseudomonadota bacterium]
MSLYQLQKFLYDLNRDPLVQHSYRADPAALLSRYELEQDERAALAAGDIGLIYVLGANGQLLMHFAAFLGLSWPAYLQAMRDGVVRHGPVRAGVYSMTSQVDEKVAGV